MENYQYELPEDFEDEEIDEDAAFGSDDDDLRAMLGEGDVEAAGAGDEAAEALNRDDFSEDVRRSMMYASLCGSGLGEVAQEALPYNQFSCMFHKGMMRHAWVQNIFGHKQDYTMQDGPYFARHLDLQKVKAA